MQLFRPNVCETAIEAVADVLRSGWIGLGPKTAQFEQAFARYVGAKYAAALNSMASDTFCLVPDGTASARKQLQTERTRYHPRQFPSHEITFDKWGRQIYDYVRALLSSPFPVPYFRIGDRRVLVVPENRLPRETVSALLGRHYVERQKSDSGDKSD